MKNLIYTLSFLMSSTALANELVLPRAEALRLGYRPVKATQHRSKADFPYAKHSLPWPVAFQDDAHTIGNSMAQYQEYGDNEPYWHGGDDLRVQEHAWITVPVAGKLSAGHYSYVNNPDGSMVKHMLPWPQRGQSLYFEVSVTTAEGYRFQFHHVDRDTLPANILKLLNAGGGQVPAGTKLGQVVEWPTEKPEGQVYNHTHFDLITPDEKELNPEFYCVLVPDTTPPTVHGVYARFGQSFLKIAERGVLTKRPDEIVVANTDVKDGNAYVQPTDYIAFVKGDQTTVVWDLRQRLLTPAGTYPAIRSWFQETLRTSDGTLSTQGNYSSDMFLSRLPVGNLSGAIQIVLKDQAGNQSVFPLTLP